MTTAPVAQDLAVRLVEFVGALRSKGIPAGTSETTDAAAVIDVLGMSDRSLLREGLASALVRRGGQRDVFDMTFDLYFPAGVGASQAARELDEDFDLDDLRDLLAMALAEDDLRTLEQVAEIAVDLLGRVGEAGPPADGRPIRRSNGCVPRRSSCKRWVNAAKEEAVVQVRASAKEATSPRASNETRSGRTSTASGQWSLARRAAGQRNFVAVMLSLVTPYARTLIASTS